MTDEQTAISRRAVASKGWRWMPGMLAVTGPARQSVRLVGSNVSQMAFGLTGEALPVLDDPATLGCLLALVREEFVSDERLWGGRVEVHQDAHNIFVVVCPEHDSNGFLLHRWIASADVEAEALVAALEDAP